jgi:SAM-dependent methyltransferase
MPLSFEELVAEGSAAPVEGWNFSWFDGRATEERPPWGYAKLMAARMARADVAVDLQTGGGEVLAGVADPPRLLVATESWPPNLRVAQSNLRPLGAHVVAAADRGPLPFADATFDLVVSRHPVTTPWAEIARILNHGGTFLSQEVGAGSARELTDFMMGPQPVSQSRSPRRAVAAAEAAGLVVVDVRTATLEMAFFDVAAVIVFLRKVIWTVPGFAVDDYLPRLAAMHEHIGANGSFVAHAERFLIEARRPA